MITLNYLVRKKGEVSAKDFTEYWMGKHANQCVQLSAELGIKKYTKCETLHEDDANKSLQGLYGTNSDCYDFVDQMVINNMEDFRAGLQTENNQTKLKKLHDESAAFVDFSGSDYWMSIDVPQLFPREEITATWYNTYIKVFYVPRRKDTLSLRESLLHWNACHGGIARQFAQFLPYDKYIQGHREPSALVDRLKTMLGGIFEDNDSIIGQAEAWLDRRILPTLQGQEVERMMRLLVQDIDLFVVAKESHIFACKEHVILSKPVITEPVPTLFNAD